MNYLNGTYMTQVLRRMHAFPYPANSSYLLGEGQASGSRIRLKLWDMLLYVRNMKKDAKLDANAKKNSKWTFLALFRK